MAAREAVTRVRRAIVQASQPLSLRIGAATRAATMNLVIAASRTEMLEATLPRTKGAGAEPSAGARRSIAASLAAAPRTTVGIVVAGTPMGIIRRSIVDSLRLAVGRADLRRVTAARQHPAIGGPAAEAAATAAEGVEAVAAEIAVIAAEVAVGAVGVLAAEAGGITTRPLEVF